MDGPLAMVPCVSLTAYAQCKDCMSEERCSLRSVMREVREATLKILDNTSLKTLAALPNSAEEFWDH